MPDNSIPFQQHPSLWLAGDRRCVTDMATASCIPVSQELTLKGIQICGTGTLHGDYGLNKVIGLHICHETHFLSMKYIIHFIGKAVKGF